MSTNEVRPASGRGIYYGWFVALACFGLTLTLGEGMYAYGVFVKPLIDEFGWDRAMVSSAYTFFLLGYSPSVLLSGRLADRFAARPILLASAVLAGFGLIMCTQVTDIGQFRLFYFITGLGSGATWSIPASAIQRWFFGRPRAGLVLGFVTTGTGLGALIFAPLLNFIIEGHGWRVAYLILGVVFFVVISAAAFVVRQSPDETEVASAARGDKPPVSGPWTGRKALATMAFITTALVNVVAVIVFQIISVHLMPHATDIGISAVAAAAAVGLMGGFSIPGRIIAGIVADRIGWQKILALCLFCTGAGILWLVFVKSTWMLYVFVFVFGLAWGGRVPAQVGILGEFFGMRAIGAIIGVTIALGQLVGSVSPFVAGYVFDRTGSYSIVFMISAALLLFAGVAVVLLKPPKVQS